MKKYLIIAVCLLTLVSCDNTLYKANSGDTTISQVETLNQDTVTYKIIVDVKSNKINIYTTDNQLVYKNCHSTYKNGLMTIPISIFLVILVLSFLIGLLIGFI